MAEYSRFLTEFAEEGFIFRGLGAVQFQVCHSERSEESHGFKLPESSKFFVMSLRVVNQSRCNLRS